MNHEQHRRGEGQTSSGEMDKIQHLLPSPPLPMEEAESGKQAGEAEICLGVLWSCPSICLGNGGKWIWWRRDQGYAMSHESSAEEGGQLVRSVLSPLSVPCPLPFHTTTPRLQVFGFQLSRISFVERLR